MSEWEQRLTLLRPYLSRFKRRFSVLDLGCGDGQINRAISREFPDAQCYLIDKGFNDTEEYSTTHYEGTERITCMKHQMDADLLGSLADAEHFDMVLALNFLHHFGFEWQAPADAVLRMGWHVFIQLPRVGMQGVAGCDIMSDLHERIQKRNPMLLGETVQFPAHLPRPLWLVLNEPTKAIPKTVMFSASGGAQEDACYVMQVHASYETKEQGHVDKGPDWRPRIVGMNLWNMLHLGVVRPTKAQLAGKVRAFVVEQPHGDIIPWNFIWDGEALHLCDWDDQFQREDGYGLEQTARITEKEPHKYPCDSM